MLSPNKMFRTVAGLALLSGAGANAAKGAITLVGTVPGYTNGTVIASGTGLNNTVLDATVQYAVFEPGTFPGTSNISGVVDLVAPNDVTTPTDLTNTSDYVYAYVVTNTAASNLNVNTLSIGYASNATIDLIGNDPSGGGVGPNTLVILGNTYTTGQYLSGGSYINAFPGIAQGSSSDVIILTSPDAPALYSATVGNGGLNDQIVLPSPAVPEPAGFALISVAGAGILSSRRRRAAYSARS